MEEDKLLGKKAFTTFEVAHVCDVTPVTIQNWIDKGWLAAYRTAGGHRRVRREDLIVFLESRNMPHRLSERPEGHPKILLIGGDEEANRLMRDVLRGEDASQEVHVAQDAFRAGVLFAAEKPDVVILDLTLAGLDGAEVCRQIRQGGPGGGASLIAILGPGDAELRGRLLQLGAAHCLQKPIDTVALRELVQGAVRKRPTPASPA
ncbi:MAG: hypothetical protein A3I72_04045 [Candidatus Tectomicrobia bacterium RIFCSPLOWO2_02_FULL_70_19]|nr:MAG: hypothetical protein A3I72_04045 [Candidatus Tectomicrobia bacterium RIFCSPLOWO2_02_FULL_70_19]